MPRGPYGWTVALTTELRRLSPRCGPFGYHICWFGGSVVLVLWLVFLAHCVFGRVLELLWCYRIFAW